MRDQVREFLLRDIKEFYFYNGLYVLDVDTTTNHFTFGRGAPHRHALLWYWKRSFQSFLQFRVPFFQPTFSHVHRYDANSPNV